ncbi:MAG: hypothetical protein M3M87_03440 [Thermoproteota archaeon]|nr:hypothetical protein [Thermoproteota archaeon]
MAKATASTTNNSLFSVVRTNRPGYLVDSSSSRSVIDRPVESFSNIEEQIA